MSDTDFDVLFTRNKPVIPRFSCLAMVHLHLTYRRTNHANIHVEGYKEDGTIITPFDMTVLNEMDRFSLVQDVIDRLPELGNRAAYLKQEMKDKLITHTRYIRKNGVDMPQILNWKWEKHG